jgi:hypothetical protein
LENTGIRSLDASMTYAETGEVLKQLAAWANALMNPQTAKESFEKLDD